MQNLVIIIKSFVLHLLLHFICVSSLCAELLHLSDKYNWTDLPLPQNPLTDWPLAQKQRCSLLILWTELHLWETLSCKKGYYFDSPSHAPNHRETLSLWFVYCLCKLSTWVFAGLELSHVGKLPAAITPGLGWFEGGPPHSAPWTR